MSKEPGWRAVTRWASWYLIASCGLAPLPRALAQSAAQSDVLALDAVVVYGEQHAPSMRAARARVGLGQAALVGARPALADNPELELGAGPRMRGGADPTLDFQARIEQRFELSGQRSARLALARSVIAVEDVRLAAARFALRVALRAAFFEALLAQERAASAQQAQAIAQQVVTIAQTRLASGEIGSLGVRVAQTDLAQATEATIAAVAQQQASRLQLSALAGFPLSDVRGLQGELPAPIKLGSVDELITRARRAQPARKLALAELAQQTKALQLTERERWAGPSLGVQFSHEDQDHNVVLGTVSLPLPLFDSHQAARAQARAERDVSSAELEAQQAELPYRIRALAIMLQAAAQRVEVYRRELLPSFRENLALIGRAFELGELDAIEVSNARARLVEAQHSALEVYRDYFHALAELETETGSDLVSESQP